MHLAMRRLVERTMRLLVRSTVTTRVRRGVRNLVSWTVVRCKMRNGMRWTVSNLVR